MCLSVCDGCGRGHNEFAGRVQNYRVPCAKLSRCHRNFLEIVKAAAGQDTQSCRLREGCHVDACHRTNDGQEHKIIWRAGPEQDTIFYLRVTACREQGSQPLSKRVISLGSFTGAVDFVLQLIRLESLGSELQQS